MMSSMGVPLGRAFSLRIALIARRTYHGLKASCAGLHVGTPDATGCRAAVSSLHCLGHGLGPRVCGSKTVQSREVSGKAVKPYRSA